MLKAKNRAVEHVISGTGENAKLRSTAQLLFLFIQKLKYKNQNCGGFCMNEVPISDLNNILEMNLGTDLKRVCKIWLTGSLASNGFIPVGFWYSCLPEIKKGFETKNKDKEHYEIYVYKEKDGIIKGFVVVRCKNSNGETKNYMEELFVDLPFQKKGIGTQLLEHVRRDKDFLETSVYQLNTDAIVFYAKKGFRIKKEQKNCVYLEPETGQWKLLMIWERETSDL